MKRRQAKKVLTGRALRGNAPWWRLIRWYRGTTMARARKRLGGYYG